MRELIEFCAAGLDVLVNNAGFAFKQACTLPFDQQARETVEINFTGTQRACRLLMPLMRENGRVVNVASRAGRL